MLTKQQVAKVLGISIRSVDRLIATSELKTCKINGSIRISALQSFFVKNDLTLEHIYTILNLIK
jgi:hypothetical protein